MLLYVLLHLMSCILNVTLGVTVLDDVSRMLLYVLLYLMS